MFTLLRVEYFSNDSYIRHNNRRATRDVRDIVLTQSRCFHSRDEAVRTGRDESHWGQRSILSRVAIATTIPRRRFTTNAIRYEQLTIIGTYD